MKLLTPDYQEKILREVYDLMEKSKNEEFIENLRVKELQDILGWIKTMEMYFIRIKQNIQEQIKIEK